MSAENEYGSQRRIMAVKVIGFEWLLRALVVNVFRQDYSFKIRCCFIGFANKQLWQPNKSNKLMTIRSFIVFKTY